MRFELPSSQLHDPLDRMERTNGRLEDLEEVQTLENLFGTKFNNPFGTNNIDVFQDNLFHMDYATMQSLAVRVGINAYVNKPRLKDCLLKAFAADCKERQAMNPPLAKKSKQLDPNNPSERKLMLELGMKV